MNKYQKALDGVRFGICINCGNDKENACGCGFKNDLETLQELIDICLKPNSIKLKLDHIQDVIDCCYETDDDGNIVKSEFNYNLGLADEYLQDIKQAYSFRVEDTRIVNELQELFGGCCVDNIKKKVQELMGNLELYKKALDISIEFNEHKRIWYQVEGYSLKDTLVNEARLELESEKQ